MQTGTSLFSGWVALQLVAGVLVYLLWAAYRRRPAPAGEQPVRVLACCTAQACIRNTFRN